MDKRAIPKGHLSFFLLHDQSGAVAIFVALLLLVFLGFGALVIDVGYMMLVRNQLQNAVDAAALSGAPYYWNDNLTKTPDWSKARRYASTDAPTNKAGSKNLTDYDVQTGCWDHSNKTFTAQSAGECSAPAITAVKVYAGRAVGKNGGPVNTFLAGAMGFPSFNASATATAIAGGPGKAEAGALFPLAIKKTFANTILNSNDTQQTVTIYNNQYTDDENGSLWTDFFNNNNSNAYIKNLITGAADSPPVEIGSNIQLAPGIRASDYGIITVNQTVALPVVGTLDKNSKMPVVGFVCFRITEVDKHGNKSYIKGHVVMNCRPASTSGTGPYYGALTPTVLVQ